MRTFHLALAAVTVGSGCVMVDTEIPHVCVQEQELEIVVPVEQLDLQTLEMLGLDPSATDVAANAANARITQEQLALLPSVAIQERFTPDGLDAIPNALDDFGADASIRLVDVRIGGRAEMFVGLERLSVTLEPEPNGTQFEPVTLAICDVNQGCDVTADEIQLVTAADRDLIPLLENEDTSLVVELVARPTVTTYQLDIDVCMGGSASIALSP